MLRRIWGTALTIDFKIDTNGRRAVPLLLQELSWRPTNPYLLRSGPARNSSTTVQAPLILCFGFIIDRVTQACSPILASGPGLLV